jgi:hypothetical protein
MKLEFSYNWNNKLNCKAFTTLRLYNPDKHRTGTPLEIFLKGADLGTGSIQGVKPMMLNDINEYIARIDTGYNREECINIIKRMYPKVDFSKQQMVLLLVVRD